MLDFFAGSGVSTCVAIENNRHSISGDTDERLLGYLELHLRQLNGSAPAYELIYDNLQPNDENRATRKSAVA